MGDPISSVHTKQEYLIKSILELHCDGADIDADVTFSKGQFYKNSILNRPGWASDIQPQLPFVIEADCRQLPVGDQSFNVVMFDPPFLATTGPSLSKSTGNKTVNRFGSFPSEPELFEFYRGSLRELYRVTKDKGVVIIKCQDKVSSGIQILSHVDLCVMAESQGFYVKDLFVLVAKTRLTPDWQCQRQRHARKFHSYFLVLERNQTKLSRSRLLRANP